MLFQYEFNLFQGISVDDAKVNFRKGLEDQKNWDECFQSAAADVLKQRERLGGNFAVSGSAITRSHRESIRKVIAKELIIIVLKPESKGLYKELLLKKHGEGTSKEILDYLAKVADESEDVAEDEENTFEINISKDMSDEDVVAKVLELVIQTHSLL